MPIYYQLIFALWILFAAYWLFMARNVKRNTGRSTWWKGSGLRALIIVAAVFALRLPGIRGFVQENRALFAVDEPLMGSLGVLITAAGIGFAIWARVYLGRNWGMPMSRKEDPELVTGGPYAYVRHPIYTGILLAMLGSALGESVFWVLPLLLFGGYFIHSARAEERLMLEQFPEQYPGYRERTKMLLPFLF